jgi:hypothetical protein
MTPGRKTTGNSEARRARTTATLLQADQPILRRTFPLDPKAGTSKKVDVGSIEVYYPGSYTFILEGPDVPRAPVSLVTLQVQQKVEPPSLPFVMGGLVLFLALAILLPIYQFGTSINK